VDRIRHARRRLGLSQEELAKASGVSAATIVQAELGNRRPQGRTLRKLAAALGVEVADLLEGEEAYPKAERSARSLRKFLQGSVGHSYLTDQALEELGRVDDVTMALYDVEYAAFLNETHTGKYTPEEREHVFGEPYTDVVRKYSTVLTAYRADSTVADAVELVRRDLVKEGFQPRDAQRNETA
jgi:transcriptional regulator with XRE-family HTH domain